LGDWKERLAPFYQKARYMLGSTPSRNQNLDDRLLAEVARDMGLEHTFRGVDVGVYYGDPDNPTDPYFDGKGPLRNGCIECGGCMVGCRHNAKNTLDKNYLYFAEQSGARIMAETLVTKVEWDPGSELYTVHTRSSTAWLGGQKRAFQARGHRLQRRRAGHAEIAARPKTPTQDPPPTSPIPWVKTCAPTPNRFAGW
jgi:cholesterol oxidase